MAQGQHGIARVRQAPEPPRRTPSGKDDLAQLRRDVEALRAHLHDLAYQVNTTNLELTRRVNELLLVDTLANRPGAGVQDRIFVATDQPAGQRVFFDTGTTWLGA